MSNYVYAIVHDRLRCLVFKKKIVGHFFQRAAKDARLHGGGKYCFPGGGQIEASIAVGARREFREETGMQIPTDVICEWRFTVDNANCCCFEIPPADLTALHTAVSHQLQLANSPAWNSTACTVQDNELENPELVLLANLPGVYFSAMDQDTDWFHSFSTKLKDNLDQ